MKNNRNGLLFFLVLVLFRIPFSFVRLVLNKITIKTGHFHCLLCKWKEYIFHLKIYILFKTLHDFGGLCINWKYIITSIFVFSKYIGQRGFYKVKRKQLNILYNHINRFKHKYHTKFVFLLINITIKVEYT